MSLTTTSKTGNNCGSLVRANTNGILPDCRDNPTTQRQQQHRVNSMTDGRNGVAVVFFFFSVLLGVFEHALELLVTKKKNSFSFFLILSRRRFFLNYCKRSKQTKQK
jgi:hypothetical protein